MKITREEFKELVEVYQKAWKDFCEYADVFNENLLDSLMFPSFTWISNKLGMIDKEGNDLLFSLVTDGYLAIVRHHNIHLTEDLDEIYNAYIEKDLR